MFATKNIITAVEVGTSKVVVLMGLTDAAGDIKVIGFGERPLVLASGTTSPGNVCKGEILDMPTVAAAVSDALHDAQVMSGYTADPKKIFIGVTGTHIKTTQGRGVAHIRSSNRMITEDNVQQALESAQIQLQNNFCFLDSFDSYYLLDDSTRRVSNPVGQVANKLEALVHIVYGDNNRVENARATLQECGYERDATPLFTIVSASFGVLSEQEKEDGVLLIDIGTGTTEYLVIQNSGIQASGVLPFGTDHIANDVHVAFSIPIEDSRKIVMHKELFAHTQTKQAMLTLNTKTHTGGKSSRQIPLYSIEKVIELRVREMLMMVQERIEKETQRKGFRLPVVLTGGAALIPYVLDMIVKIFDAPVSVGMPRNVSSAVPNIQSPRYGMVVGLLMYGNVILHMNPGTTNAFLEKIDTVPELPNRLFNKVKKVFRF